MELMIPPGRIDRPVDYETDHALGPADAEITLVEYSSYAGPHCRAANECIAQARDQLGDRVRYAFHHRPVTDNSLAYRAADLDVNADLAFGGSDAVRRAGKVVSKRSGLLGRQHRRVRRIDSFGRCWDCCALGASPQQLIEEAPEGAGMLVS
jgi:hypothetical protein